MDESSVAESKVLTNVAKKLACNDKRKRDKALRNLKKWIKGKEELAKSLSELIHILGTQKDRLLFLEAFLITQIREWHGIDRFRLDKFLMLQRCFYRQTLASISNEDWAREYVKSVVSVLDSRILSSENCPDGLKLHLADMYLEELETAAPEDDVIITDFLLPWVQLMPRLAKTNLFEHYLKRVFMRIVDQTLDHRYQGDDEEDESDDEEENDKVLLPFNYKELGDQIFAKAAQKSCLARNRKDLYDLAGVFHKLAEGQLPHNNMRIKKKNPRANTVKTMTNGDVTEPPTPESGSPAPTEKQRKRKRKESVGKEITPKKLKKVEDKVDKKQYAADSVDVTSPAKKKKKKKTHSPATVAEAEQSPVDAGLKKKKRNSPTSSPVAADSSKTTPFKSPKSKRPKMEKPTSSGGSKRTKQIEKAQALLSKLEAQSPQTLSPMASGSGEHDMKKAFLRLDTSTPSRSPPKREMASFAQFEKMNKTPPAFVRKSISKLTQKARSEPPKRTKSATDRKKRVSFGLHLNTSQEVGQVKTGPGAFSPSRQPGDGILRRKSLQ